MKTIFEKINRYLETEHPVPGLSIGIITSNTYDNFSWGYFSERNSKTVDSNTIYDLASITKLYTTLVVLDLVRNDKLQLGDKCSKYLPSFWNSNIKIVDLLTHRANFNVRLGAIRDKYIATINTEIFKIIPPKECSEEVHYENLTFLYLGRIIEIICSKSISDVFNELFQKYDLTNTHLGIVGQNNYLSPPTEIVNDLLIENYTHDETARLLGGIAGNAGIFSSVNDLLKFGKIWIEDDFFKKLAFQNYNFSGTVLQGLGWWNRVQNYPKATPNIFSHSGYTGGIIMVHIPSDTVCVMLSNRTYLGRDNKKHQFIWHLLCKELNN